MADQAELYRFSVGTFNLLAPCHKRERTQSGSKARETRFPAKFIPRHEGIVDLLKASGPPDVVCLQEFSSELAVYQLFEQNFSKEYTLQFYPRPSASEGLFVMVNRHYVVEQVINQELSGSWNGRIALHILVSLGEGKPKVLVSTTHLEYPHYSMMEGFQVYQVQSLLSRIKDIVGHTPDPVAVFLCGDFNTYPGSSVYKAVYSEGFVSAYHSVHDHEPKVTHRDHRGNEVAADYIFYRPISSQPLNAALHPVNFSDQKWPVEFVLSDHRLLTAQFEVRTPQESGPSWREVGIDPLLEEPQGSSSKTCTIS